MKVPIALAYVAADDELQSIARAILIAERIATIMGKPDSEISQLFTEESVAEMLTDDGLVPNRTNIDKVLAILREAQE